jgi:ribosomal 30S subunit maturation factor RimM
MTTPSDLFCVGAIAGAFGVHGEVRLKSFTAEAEAIADYAPLMREDGSGNFDVVLTRSIKNGLAARLSGVTTKEDPAALRACSFTRRATDCLSWKRTSITTPTSSGSKFVTLAERFWVR